MEVDVTYADVAWAKGEVLKMNKSRNISQMLKIVKDTENAKLN